jgi:hypothetical protein
MPSFHTACMFYFSIARVYKHNTDFLWHVFGVLVSTITMVHTGTIYRSLISSKCSNYFVKFEKFGLWLCQFFYVCDKCTYWKAASYLPKSLFVCSCSYVFCIVVNFFYICMHVNDSWTAPYWNLLVMGLASLINKVFHSFVDFIQLNTDLRRLKVIYVEVISTGIFIHLLDFLLLSSYLSRIPTSPNCFSVGSCNFKLQYINSIFSHALFTATHIYNIII